MFKRIALISLFLLIFTSGVFGEERVYVLRKPDYSEEIKSIYINEELRFKFELPEGYTFYEEVSEEGVFNLTILKDKNPIIGALTIEELEDELTSRRYWMRMLANDPTLEEYLVYERGALFGKTNGIQVRMEGYKLKNHFLILAIMFTSESTGYSISCYTDSGFFEEIPDFLEEISAGFEIFDDEEPLILDSGSSSAEAVSLADDDSEGAF